MINKYECNNVTSLIIMALLDKIIHCDIILINLMQLNTICVFLFHKYTHTYSFIALHIDLFYKHTYPYIYTKTLYIDTMYCLSLTNC